MALKDVVGHERPIGMLRHALRAGRLSTSYIFAGESGIGKRFTALNFAKLFNCLSGGKDACDECPSCRKINSGVHPDVLVVEPETSEIKVGQVRDANSALHLKPHEGRMKVLIVDDAETMNEEAANAFLKTIEEPPPESVIILVSANPEVLPATVLSRCMRVNFRPLTPAETETVLKRHDTGGEALVRLSMGRPGIALKGDLIEERAGFLAQLKEIERPGSKAAWKDRDEMEAWLDFCMALMRDAVVHKLTGGTETLINKDLAAQIGQISGKAETETLIERFDRLQGLRQNLRFNLNKAITWNYAGTILRGALQGTGE